MKASLATAVGAIAGALIYYLLNYHVTLASNRAHRQSVPRFVVVAILGVVINGLGMEPLHGQGGLHHLVSRVVSRGPCFALASF